MTTPNADPSDYDIDGAPMGADNAPTDLSDHPGESDDNGDDASAPRETTQIVTDVKGLL